MEAAAHPSTAVPHRPPPPLHCRLLAAEARTLKDVKSDYETLCSKLRDISALGSAWGVLSWDEKVMMPEGASAARGAASAALAGVLYDKQTDPELGKLLERLQAAGADAGLDEFEQARGGPRAAAGSCSVG